MGDTSIRREVRIWTLEVLKNLVESKLSSSKIGKSFPISPGFVGETPSINNFFQLRVESKDVPEIVERILYFAIPQDTEVPFIWARKYPVNLKGRFLEKGSCPNELENISIGVLPEGYVFGVRSPSGTYFPDDPNAYIKHSYLRIVRREGHIFLRRNEEAKPPPLALEIMKEIKPEDLVSPGLHFRTVYEQLKRFGVAPFYYLLVCGNLHLADAFKIAATSIDERGVIKYCKKMECSVTKDWWDALLKNRSFRKHIFSKCNGYCYVELLRLCRENLGHVKQKLMSFEIAKDTQSFDYVEMKLQYCFLKALFQFASWLVRPTGNFEKVYKYRKAIVHKLLGYQKMLEPIIGCNEEKLPQEYEGLIIIDKPRKFALVLNELLNYLLDWIGQRMDPKHLSLLEECLEKFKHFENFEKFYGNLIDSVISLIKSLKKKDGEEIPSAKRVTYEDICREMPEVEKIITKKTFNFTLEEKTKEILKYRIAAYIAYHKKVSQQKPRRVSVSKIINMIIQEDPLWNEILPTGFKNKSIYDFIERNEH